MCLIDLNSSKSSADNDNLQFGEKLVNVDQDNGVKRPRRKVAPLENTRCDGSWSRIIIIHIYDSKTRTEVHGLNRG